MSVLRLSKSFNRLCNLQRPLIRAHINRNVHIRPAITTIAFKIHRFYSTATIPEAKDADSILDIIHQTEDKTTKQYNDLLTKLAAEGRSAQAQKVYDEIFRDHNIIADITTYSQLMLAYINDGKYEDAMEIYYELRDHEDSANYSVKNLRLNAETYAAMITSLTSSKNMTLNQHQFDPTAEPFYEYSVEDNSAIFQDLEGESQPALLTALTLFNDMRHLEIQPSADMYSSMLQACAEQKDEFVLEKLHKLIRMDLYLDPDVGLYNRLMMAYNAIGDSNSVLEIWDTMKTNMDSTSISIIFKTCLNYGYKSRATSIYQDLKSQHIKIPVADFNNYLQTRLNEVEQEEEAEVQSLLKEGDESSVNLYKQITNKQNS